jgi:hypothetical protein
MRGCLAVLVTALVAAVAAALATWITLLLFCNCTAAGR